MKTERRSYRPYARIVVAAALILMVPLLAMLVTDEVAWGPGDFMIAAILLIGTGFAYQALAGRAGNTAYRAAAGLALGGALLLVWMNLAVGIIGDEGNPANLMHLGVLAIGFGGAVLARLRPRGMALALFAMALAQALVGVVAATLGLGAPENTAIQLLALHAFFAGLFAAAGWLFRQSAGERGPAGAPAT